MIEGLVYEKEGDSEVPKVKNL